MIFSLSRLLINNKNIGWIHVHDGHLESLIGTLVDVKITNSNQNTLFGEIETNMKAA